MYGCVTVLVVVSKVLDVVMRLWSVWHNAPCSVLLESRTRGVVAVFWREGVRTYYCRVPVRQVFWKQVRAVSGNLMQRVSETDRLLLWVYLALRMSATAPHFSNGFVFVFLSCHHL